MEEEFKETYNTACEDMVDTYGEDYIIYI